MEDNRVVFPICILIYFPNHFLLDKVLNLIPIMVLNVELHPYKRFSKITYELNLYVAKAYLKSLYACKIFVYSSKKL